MRLFWAPTITLYSRSSGRRCTWNGTHALRYGLCQLHEWIAVLLVRHQLHGCDWLSCQTWRYLQEHRSCLGASTWRSCAVIDGEVGGVSGGVLLFLIARLVVLLVVREDLAVIREFESSGENIALWGMLARNEGFERYVANRKPLISFTQLGCCDARGEQYSARSRQKIQTL